MMVKMGKKHYTGPDGVFYDQKADVIFVLVRKGMEMIWNGKCLETYEEYLYSGPNDRGEFIDNAKVVVTDFHKNIVRIGDYLESKQKDV